VLVISKLQAHGFRGNVLQWIENWLYGKQQRVVLNGQCSDWNLVLSGVTQGSVLGGWDHSCLIVYINDIDEQIVSKILKFADDTKLSYCTVTQGHRDIAVRSPQISRMVQVLANALKYMKCKVLHIGFNNPHTDGVKLHLVKEEKDLGVTVSADMKWERQCIQCMEAVKKTNKMLGLIKRNFQDKSKETVMPLYKSLVRPHLEYCCQVWSPYLSKDINLIEC